MHNQQWFIDLYSLTLYTVAKFSQQLLATVKISTRERYGVRLLLDLAIHWGQGPVLLRDIARRQELPLLYIEHLIAPLVVGGLIKTTRGPRGGISLFKHPDEVNLGEAIQLLEGPIALVDCVNNPEAYSRSKYCAVRDIWIEVKKIACETLEHITLQDLAERQKRKEQSEDITN